MNLSVSNAGTAPLVKMKVHPFVSGNLALRATYVRVDNTFNERVIMTGARLRTNHLLALDTTSNRKYRAATKDHNDVWSEMNDVQIYAISNFSNGASERSIGSASSNIREVEEPGVNFPDLSVGTGYAIVHRTIVDEEAFYDESTLYTAHDPRMVFNVKLVDLDAYQVNLLHKWYQTLNGPTRPFYFDFKDPAREDDVVRSEVRYVVRFRDPSIADELFEVDRSNLSFVLVEVVHTHKGGDV